MDRTEVLIADLLLAVDSLPKVFDACWLAGTDAEPVRHYPSRRRAIGASLKMEST